MKKLLLISTLLFVLSFNSNAQMYNVLVGYSPVGNTNIHVRQSDGEGIIGKYHLHYNAQKGYHLSVDLPTLSQWGDNVSIALLPMTSLSYSTFSLDECEKEDGDNIPCIEPSKLEDISMYSFDFMMGVSFNFAHSRFQLPFYWGFGADYVSGAPFKHLFPTVVGKVRLKVGVLRTVYVYGGLNAKIGMSMGKTGYSKEYSPNLTFYKLGVCPEVGFGFTINSHKQY